MTALVAAATYLLLSDRVATTRAVSVGSLAVLPFQNLHPIRLRNSSLMESRKR